ncbi:MAG: YfhO family protein, partial [bacterium]|nr:YfhO family protein [bacterium]
IPWNKFAHDELRDGRIPAWDPYCLGGVPLLQNHLVPIFYPIYALIAWLLPPLFILGASGFFHTLIMAVFFYLFIKEWQENRIASWASASFLVVSLLPAAHYQPWPITIAFFPAIWFFYERWLKHRNLWAGLWMALCWSAPLLAGYPSLFVQLTIFTAVWFFIRARMIDFDSRPSWKQTALIFALPFMLGLGISMVQNIPTLMASANSDRVVFKSSHELASEYSWAVPQNEPWQEHLKRLLQPLLPVKFRSNDFLNRGNVGIIPFIFAMFGLTGWRRREFPKSVVWTAIAVAPFALIPALNFAVYWITRALLIDPNPPLEVLGFLILMLSAIGVKRWVEIADLEKPVEIKFTTALVPTGVGIFIALLGSIFISRGSFVPNGDPTFMAIAAAGIIISAFLIDSRKHFSYAIAAISFCLLYSAIMSGTFVLSDFTSPNSKNPMPETATVRALEKMVDPENGGNWGRMIRYSNAPVDAMSIPDQSYTFYPNLGTYFEIPDAFGYHNLAPRMRFQLLREIQPEMVIERRGIVAFTPPVDLSDQRLFNLGVRYVLSDSAIEGLVPLNDNVNFPVYDLYGQVKRLTPPTRVTIIPSVETLENMERINLRRLTPPEIFLDKPGYFVAVADYEFSGLLVLNEGYAPGWLVKVDGERRELKVHEDFSMGVDIESGRHVVEFRYRMPGWKEGMTVTVTSLL